MELDGILADILIALAGYWLSTAGDLRKVDNHSSLQSFLVKIVLVVVSMFVTGKRDVVQEYELLEVREPVGAVRQVGSLKIVSQVK